MRTTTIFALVPVLAASLSVAHAQEVPFRTVGRGDCVDAVGPPQGGDFVIRSRADLERLDLGEFVHEEIAWGKRLLLASVRDARADGRAHTVEIKRVERVPGAPRLIVEVDAWVAPVGAPLKRGTGERPVHIIELAIDPGVHVEFRARYQEPSTQQTPATQQTPGAQQTPATQAPATQAPVTQTPATQTPATTQEAPATQQTPATQAPAATGGLAGQLTGERPQQQATPARPKRQRAR